MNEIYYSVDDVARLLKLHEKTVQRYIREGRLQANKVGKAWRINGHDLSQFVEGTDSTGGGKKTDARPQDTQVSNVSISTVVDIDVLDMEQGMRIVNTMTAALNAKQASYGASSMSAQMIEPESKVRIMLWGSIRFMENMLASIAMLTEPKEGETT